MVDTPYPIYFDQALTCARILSRLLPFMLESKSEEMKNLFWRKQSIAKQQQQLNTKNNSNDKKQKKKNVAKADSKDDENTKNNDNNNNSAGEETEETEPLAVILVNAIFHLLFLPGKTITKYFSYLVSQKGRN